MIEFFRSNEEWVQSTFPIVRFLWNKFSKCADSHWNKNFSTETLPWKMRFISLCWMKYPRSWYLSDNQPKKICSDLLLLITRAQHHPHYSNVLNKRTGWKLLKNNKRMGLNKHTGLEISISKFMIHCNVHKKDFWGVKTNDYSRYQKIF